MIKWAKKHKVKVALYALVAFLVIPLLINVSFIVGATHPIICVAWSAGDALAFYGTILAMFGTVIGVYLSIRQSQIGYREDFKNRVLPYLAVTQLRGRSTYDIFIDGFDNDGNHGDAHNDENASGTPNYTEYRLTQIYFVIENGAIVNYTALPEKYKQMLQTSGASWTTVRSGVEILSKTSYLSCPLELENIGKGPAVYLRVGFYPASEEPRYLPPIVLKPGQTFYIHIFSILPLEQMANKYILDFSYQDIYKNGYSQSFPFQREGKGYALIIDVKQEATDAASGIPDNIS